MDGYLLKGYSCPLSAVTARHPQVCALASALVEDITGRPVTSAASETAAHGADSESTTSRMLSVG